MGPGRRHSDSRVLRATGTHCTPSILRYKGLQKAALHLRGCLTHSGAPGVAVSLPPVPVQGKIWRPWLAEVCCCPLVTSCALQRMSCASSPLARAFLDSLSQRALAIENFLYLKLTFFSLSHVFHELKGNIIFIFICSCCIANSAYCTDPARKGCLPFVQVADIPGTSAPLSLSCTLHSRH